MRIGKYKITAKMPGKYDFWMHLSILVLVVFGTLMIISTNLGNVYNDQWILMKVILKQTVFIIISYSLMLFLANNFSMLRAKRLSMPIGIAIGIALIACLFSAEVNGSRAWIQIPLPGIQVTLQPSEFAKIFMVVIMAVYVEIAGRRKFDFWTIVKIPVYFYMAFAAIIVLQRDFGTLLVMSTICALCFLLPSHKNLRKAQRMLMIAMIFAIVFGVFAMSDWGISLFNKVPGLSHIANRIESSLNPFQNPYSGGYQLINGLFGIANSNFFGLGIGNSTRKWGYLTQADNDFILSIVIEELGIFGLLIIVAGYIIIIQRLFHYALRTKSEGYKIILVGTALYIIVHFVLNVGGVSGLIPLTGVPLLFISSGGSSLMSVMAALGICQAVISRIRRQGE